MLITGYNRMVTDLRRGKNNCISDSSVNLPVTEYPCQCGNPPVNGYHGTSIKHIIDAAFNDLLAMVGILLSNFCDSDRRHTEIFPALNIPLCLFRPPLEMGDPDPRIKKVSDGDPPPPPD